MNIRKELEVRGLLAKLNVDNLGAFLRIIRFDMSRIQLLM